MENKVIAAAAIVLADMLGTLIHVAAIGTGRVAKIETRQLSPFADDIVDRARDALQHEV
jgi:hypothetical protein